MKQAYSPENQANNGLIAAQKSNSTFPVVCAAGVAQQVAVPSGARFVAFGFSGDFWADVNNASIAVPSVTATVAVTIEFNPAGWAIDGSAATINIIAGAAVSGTVVFYA